LLHFAAMSGHAEACRQLVESGADDARDVEQWMALHFAPVFERVATYTCRLLIELGADISATTQVSTHNVVVSARRSHGADISASANDISSIHTAAQGNHVQPTVQDAK
jgi:ankyrin repeat protein